MKHFGLLLCAALSVAASSEAATFTRSMERVSTMDPAQGRSVYDSRAQRLVYKSVLEVDYAARPYKIAPCACDLPEVSEDGLTYRFRVLDEALTAEDVVRSLERLRDPEAVSPNGWMVAGVDTMEALDERTVEIRLKARCHYFPWLMTMPAAAVMKADGSGTGAFELASWWKNHEMTFRRRKPEPGTFDEVRYLVVDDVSTQWLMFLKGEMDFLGEISRDNWDAVVGVDGKLDPALEKMGVKLHSVPTLDTMYLGINMRDPVLGGNKKLRQALNAAFDYPAWERFYSGRIIKAGGPVPPGIDGYLDEPFEHSFNLENARRLMAEAGYPDGIDPKTGRRLVLTLTIGRASQDSREAGELVAAFYEKIGVKLELAFQTWDAFLKSVNDGRVQLYRMGWVGDYPDAQNFLQLFYSKNKSPGPNHSDYDSAEFDREYDLALAAASAEERNMHWRRCQQILRDDCPWVFTHFNKSNMLVRPTVGNYVPSVFPYGAEEHYTVTETE